MRAYLPLLTVMLAGSTGVPTQTGSEDRSMVQMMPPPGARGSSKADLTALASATAWLNSEPLTAAGLKGKVVLIEFWTYTCINWLHIQPYVAAWADKYKDRGLVVIGVHSPEFRFEKNLDNVRRAAKALEVRYPIAVDSEHAIWNAFNNQYWPALYLIDGKGDIRYHQFGEGEYEQSERTIQQLLAETGNKEAGNDLVSVKGKGIEAAADWATLRSPENYVGYDRTENFASPGGAAEDKSRVYAAPKGLKLNQWALVGDWTMGRQATLLNQSGGRVIYRFHGRDLHLVMGPHTAGSSVRFRVLIDGRPAGAAHGLDVDAEGNGTVTDPRLYQLIRQPGPIADRVFEIEFLDPGVEIFAFTFG